MTLSIQKCNSHNFDQCKTYSDQELTKETTLQKKAVLKRNIALVALVASAIIMVAGLLLLPTGLGSSLALAVDHFNKKILPHQRRIEDLITIKNGLR